MDQGSLTKALPGYRLGGLVGVCIGIGISYFFPTYFVWITPFVFVLILGLIGNEIHKSIQTLFDSLPLRILELWVLKLFGVITEEKYKELVKVVEKRILR